MKRIMTILALAVVGIQAMAQAPAGSVSYSLPKTVLNFTVEAQGVHYTAGPYARYADKFLGLDVKEEDSTTWQVVSVDMVSAVEADAAARMATVAGKGFMEEAAPFLTLTSQGLVSACADDAKTAHFEIERAKSASFGSVPVSEDIMGVATLEGKAAKAVDMIMLMRKTRVQILTGDTDASYTGEAMKAALDEINRLEAAYMSLFTGITTVTTQKMSYSIAPDASKANQQYVLFGLSETEGLVPALSNEGKPYILELTPEAVQQPSVAGNAKAQGIKYEVRSRVPSNCDVKLSDGVNILLQGRVPVYQLGTEVSYPIYLK